MDQYSPPFRIISPICLISTTVIVKLIVMAIREQTIECTVYGRDVNKCEEPKDGLKGSLRIVNHMLGRTPCAVATEFIVINSFKLSDKILKIKGTEIRSSRDYDAFLQLRIGDRRMFHDFMGDDTLGLHKNVLNRGMNVGPKNFFDKLPWCASQLVISPGESYEFILSCFTPMDDDEQIDISIYYTLYDGKDAVLAHVLKELNTNITPDNIDWLRQKTNEKNMDLGDSND